jgi:glycosyltransferase involved in cell wall biosynthesis
MRIAIPAKTFYRSGGGIHFLSYLVKALSHNEKNKEALKLFLFIPKDNKKNYITKIKLFLGGIKRYLIKKTGMNHKIEFIPSAEENLAKIMLKINKNIEIVFYKDNDPEFKKKLKDFCIDLVIPLMGTLPKNFSIPWVGGIYDFQYKYYPSFFPNDNFQERDKSVQSLLDNAKSIIVNSLNTKNDIKKFFKFTKNNVFCLPPAIYPEEEWIDQNYSSIREKYKLPQKYFLISNQFWIHKSHITAFEALSLIHKNPKYSDVKIVCTGITKDSRFPNYLENLKEKISSLNLETSISFLGYVEKNDQIQIMKESIGLLQPTLFEGGPGGGAVYNSIALDIPTIISDIPANLELKKENADVHFFKAGSPKELAKKMTFILERNKPNKKDKKELIDLGKKRMKNYRKALFKAIEAAIN